MDKEIEQLINRETDKLQVLLQDALDKHHEREAWVAEDVTYTHSDPAIPPSIKEFAATYLDGIAKIIAAAKS